MKKSTIKVIIAIIVFLILISCNLIIGATFSSFKDFIYAISNPSSTEYTIIYLRLLRTIACILVGAALSVAGLLLQIMLNNSLAGPGTIGINSGAGLAVVFASLFISNSIFGLTFSTFIGAFLSAMLIYFIAKVSGSSRNKLILAGIAISRLFSALIDTIVYFEPSALTNKATFQLGSLARVNQNSLIFAGAFIIIGLVLAIILSRYLNILVLGEDTATSLGVNVKLVRFLILFDVALLSAGAVSIAGLLSFLGLIVPHIVRRIFKDDNKNIVPITIIVGACLTLLCDLLSRTLFIPYELPVGIIMSLLGVPFFIYLLFNKKFRVKQTKIDKKENTL